MKNISVKAVAAALFAATLGVPSLGIAATAPSLATRAAAGVNRVHSIYAFDDTVAHIKADVAAKGIKFFDEIDQSRLGEDAKIAIPHSKLLLFGNPPLGVQFLSANPYAGLDWPVRMLVVEDTDGSVWVAWTDFGYLKKRYALTGRDAALKMATMVSASIAASTTK